RDAASADYQTPRIHLQPPGEARVEELGSYTFEIRQGLPARIQTRPGNSAIFHGRARGACGRSAARAGGPWVKSRVSRNTRAKCPRGGPSRSASTITWKF